MPESDTLGKTLVEQIRLFDSLAHKALTRTLESLPGSNKHLSGFGLLCGLAIALACAGIFAGSGISAEALLILPVILSSIYLSRGYAYCLAAISSVLAVISFKVSNVADGGPFSISLNLPLALLGFIALAEFGSLATETIRELLSYIDALHEELALERLKNGEASGNAELDEDE
ncbi:hypothetical protein [Methylocystis parvus]|uniref:Uncharacterized protein n=1 Tax=Methylocystis parvus TaxID=134 RepID=A0A6B8MA39_9HYPH|nr:hypothetical protein [Methylocystis parvus]QGM98622.1 hypothetical protein F7D14_14805 [Methylocystis parvus]WBK01032.1 hypothetical protein MMG94_04760 [Methylocystis parvus OBBP]